MNQNNFYTIKDVSDKTGIHPQTLRNWEKEGLIVPTRVAGQQRIYTDADLARINEIMNLKEEGYQIKGIRNVLIGRGVKKGTKVGRPTKNTHMIAAAHLETPIAPAPRRGRPPKVKTYSYAELEQKNIKELTDIAQEMGIKYFRQMLKEELIVAIADPARREEAITQAKERTKERYGDKQYGRKDTDGNEEAVNEDVEEVTTVSDTLETVASNLVEEEEDIQEDLVEANDLEEAEHEINEQQKLIEEILQLGNQGKTPTEIARILVENHKNDI